MLKRPNHWLGSNRGLSLIEILVVTVILLMLLLAAMRIFAPHLLKAKDSRRKSDLDKIKVAFEEYYSDVGCYPPECALSTCTEEIDDYIRGDIPTDPKTKDSYVFVVFPGGTECDERKDGFQVFAALENLSDPDIVALGCEGGCGLDSWRVPNPDDYVYGVSEGVPVGNYTPTVDTSNPCVLPPLNPAFCHDENGQCNNATGAGLDADGRCNFPDSNPPSGCPYIDSNCSMR